MITKFVATLAALTLILGLTACTSSGNGSTPTSSGAPTSRSSGKATKSSGVPTIPSQHPLPNPSKIANSVKLRKQVAITKCASTPKGWMAAGNAVNTAAKKALDVDITVFFTTTSATVLDYARTKVKVEPGKTGKWSASADFKAAKNMRCVLRGVG